MSPQLSKIFGKLRQYPVAIIAFSLVGVAAVAIFLRSAELSALETELADRESEWDRISANLKRARDLESNLATIRASIADIEARLMDPGERAINYDYFYGLEKAAGVRLSKLQQGGVIDTTAGAIAGVEEFKKYQLIGYAVGVVGTFSEIVDFLHRLKQGHHFVRISSFAVSSDKQVEGELTANFELQILGTSDEG